MLAALWTPLIFLLSVVQSLCAIALVSKPVSLVHTGSDSPAVIDAANGELVIANKVIAPDGFPRSATLAGGTFPGPIIQAQKGQDFSINVINNLDDPSMELTTTIHWHGITQNRSNWADGVSFITQCPIRPGQQFRYRFNAQNQTGTYWYHSHHGLQYCDGLRGPLIIYDVHDPHSHLYDIDNANTVITLADWWDRPASLLTVPYTPNSTLVNGKGRRFDGPKAPLSVIDVEPGKRYRFRILGISCHSWFNFTMDHHPMTIIEVDGIETVPHTVDWIQVLAGQRYSVVVTTDRSVDNYWIRTLSSHINQSCADGMNSAILRYTGAPDEEPTTIQRPAVSHFDENHLHPLESLPPPGVPKLGEADVVLNLVAGFHGAFTVNGVSFKSPPIPVLLQVLSGARHPSELLPSGTIYELPRNKVIEINMPANELSPGGAMAGPHGMHLHGHNFHVIRTATNSTPNFINPPKRDTVSMGSQALQSNVTIRFITDNPGPWFLHCHIDFHLLHGFAVILAEAPDAAAIQQKTVLPTSWDNLCPADVLEAADLFATTGSFNLAGLNFTNGTNLTGSNAGPTPIPNRTTSHTDMNTMPPTFAPLL